MLEAARQRFRLVLDELALASVEGYFVLSAEGIFENRKKAAALKIEVKVLSKPWPTSCEEAAGPAGQATGSSHPSGHRN